METYYGTKNVAEKLGLKPQTLNMAIWQGRVTPPAKGPAGNFLWTDEDINRASWALLHRAYEPKKEAASA